jgi:RND family efflux transporter MFP subunit
VGRARRTITLLGVGSFAVTAALFARGGGPGRSGADPVMRAERRQLEVTLVEPGTLIAARSVTLASEIRSNRAKIVSLLADGTWVKKNDVIVRFDPTPFEEEHGKALADLRDAQADAARLEQERKLQAAKAEETLESERHHVRIAELNLEAYERGTGALTVREAEVRSAGSASDLDRARRDLADMQVMFERGFVSEGELGRQRLKVEGLARESGLEADRLRTAREVTFPRDLERAKTQLQEAKDGVARAESVLYFTHEFYRASAESAARKIETASEAERIAEEQLQKTAIASPLDGFLVLQDIPLESGKRRPQVGDSVWSGVPIATVPDLSQMVVLARVREVDLHRVRDGLKASVALEAYPDLVLDGRIALIGSLAEEVPNSPWKFFTVSLQLEHGDSRLRPGMSVRVSFLLDAVRDAVVVPVDAVFTRGEESVCYVRRGGETVEQVVALGKRNETHVEVRRGISEGDELLLSAPEGHVRRQDLPESDA